MADPFLTGRLDTDSHMPGDLIEAERRAWRRRLAELNRTAAAEIRRRREDGMSFTAAVEAFLESLEGVRALAEYEMINDALADGGCSAARGATSQLN